jgi:hypothetical protein
MWDDPGVLDENPKTLCLCIVVEHSSKKQAIPTMLSDILEEIMEYETRLTPLHLKIAAWHDNCKRSGDKLPFALDYLKKALMLRQALLKKLNPYYDSIGKSHCSGGASCAGTISAQILAPHSSGLQP